MGAGPGGVDVVVTNAEGGDHLESGKSLHKGTIHPLLGSRHRHAAPAGPHGGGGAGGRLLRGSAGREFSRGWRARGALLMLGGWGALIGKIPFFSPFFFPFRIFPPPIRRGWRKNFLNPPKNSAPGP